MDLQVNLCVSCRGESQNFLVSDSAKTTWADVEAMVLVSFDLSDIQIKYVDEDNEEVSVNSQDEYEEALKIAVKQGGILQMNVYENQQQLDQTPRNQQFLETIESGETHAIRGGKRSLTHHSLVARSPRQEELSPPATEQSSTTTDSGSSPSPPEWFTSYMNRFKEQIINETVQKVSLIMRDRLSPSQDWMSDSSCSSAPLKESERPTSMGSLYDWLLACSNCRKRILGIRYQCSVCPSFSVCEHCEAEGCEHDPNHLFLKMRRPVEPRVEGRSPPHPFSFEHVRFHKHMHKTFLKAEKQRLRAEKRQRKAEVKEVEKQLKLHRRLHLWHSIDSPQPPLESPESSPLVIPMEPCSQFIPTLSAVFVDENLPDGTHLQPGTRFIKHWRMKNTGNVKWNLDTKLNFMWGNLTLASSSRKDAPVPSLLPGQVGVLSVEFIAPALEGTYTSHWRLAHKGEQFGPRVWCSIIVDSLPCADHLENLEKDVSSIKINNQKDQEEEDTSVHMTQQLEGCPDKETASTASSHMGSAHADRELYIPSVDLLTAQDLLSFELLDINIVQELERVPHNTPVDMTPCMSPLPHDGPLIEKPGLGQIKEETDGAGYKTLTVKKSTEDMENTPTQEEAEEDISGTQFVCETVMRSLTLDAAPDYKPPQKKQSPHSSVHSSPQTSFSYSVTPDEDVTLKSSPVVSRPVLLESTDTNAQDLEMTTDTAIADIGQVHLCDIEQQTPDESQRDEVESQASSDTSEDYIIILPECFDTSRPLGESLYSSALSESQGDKGDSESRMDETRERGSPVQSHSINDILTTSQTLDAIPLTPEVLTPSPQLRFLQEAQTVSSNVEEARPADIRASITEQTSTAPNENVVRPQPAETPLPPRAGFDHTSRQHTRVSIAGGLVKGALSVAASAYKALFVGQQETAMPPCSEEQAGAMMAVLVEMGFCDRQLNQRLLRKHNYNLMDVVTELIQINDNDWYSARY
ncbi:next to BRCA1 gene 1 protein isoform X2 [Pseudophryne corroboree]|uniref:next to BRCA1 gene 1 protein isoform X2 n=1 Tax=Pseudophryne corroboree TaxID=495146 RepID=UPI003081263A